MAFEEKEMKEQEQAFLAIKDEFSRLTAQLDGMCQEAGLSAEDLKKTLEEKLPPELEKALNQAKEEAARAGQARAAQAGPAQSAPAGRSGRGRPGAVKI
ncbi:MAG: hypothetical protein FWG17_07810 [Desulfovibrionaceae bacterium]|nr:hypothetical protein [Desulfovibrionaceae bacterium]